jgi:hypothetical protein
MNLQQTEYQPDFYKIAAKMLMMGAYVVPVPTGQKACILPDWQNKASRDLRQIEKWYGENQHYNCAIVGKPEIGALWGFDDDSGILAEYEAKHGTLKTYRTRTVSGGTHLLFKHNQKSIAMGNLSEKNEQNQELWSARGTNRYVMSAGSVAHPNNDLSQPLTAYTAIDTTMPIEAPDTFIAFLQEKASEIAKAKTGEKELDESPVHEGGRNNMLASVLGRARQVLGMNTEQLYEYGCSVNRNRCVPPLPDSEVRSVANSIGGYEVKQAPKVIMGGQPLTQGSSYPETSPADWRSQFRNLSEMEQGDTVMIIDGVLQEGTCFLGGNPAHGKTLVALAFAKAITLGKPLFGIPEYSVKQPRRVIYLIPEVADRPFRHRGEIFRLPQDDRFIARTISSGAPLTLSDPALMEAVRQLKPVVILDTASRFLHADDENSAAQNRLLVNDITALRAAGAVCVIILHHAKKSQSAKREAMTLENMLRGTSDFGAMCDQAYGIRRDEHLYNHGAGPMEIELVNLKDREGLGGLTSVRLAASYKKPEAIFPTSYIDETGNFRPVDYKESKARDEATLNSLVEANPMITIAELSEATGTTKYTVTACLKNFGWHCAKGGPDGRPPWHKDGEQGCPYQKRGKSAAAVNLDLPPAPTLATVN